MKILALDPSIRCLGGILADTVTRDVIPFAVATEHEAEKLGIYEGDDLARRIREILVEVRGRLQTIPIPARFDVIVVSEQPAGAMGAGAHPCSCGKGMHIPGIQKAATALGATLAMVTTLCAVERLDLRWVRVGDVKKALLGKRSGPKEAMVEIASARLAVLGVDLAKWTKPKREAIADAYAVLVASGLWTEIESRSWDDDRERGRATTTVQEGDGAYHRGRRKTSRRPRSPKPALFEEGSFDGEEGE